MKKNLLIVALCFIQLAGYSKIQIIGNAGTTFSPSTVTITLGDTVQFTIDGSHNAVEISKATWDSNGTTSLAGGFSVSNGGGTVLPAKLTVGTHYYICTPHASLGMKGTIIVKSPNGISENQSLSPISIFPSPAIDFITVKGSNTLGVAYSIFSLDGKQVLSGKLQHQETGITLNGLAVGTYYFMAEGIERKAFTVVHP
jgi:plastocyanin